MKLRLHFPLFVTVLLTGSTGRAEENALDAIVRDSPFGAAAAGAEAGAPVSGPEFRSYYTQGREQFFSIYEPGQKRSFWLRTGEADSGLAVKGFDAGRQILRVELAGRELTLPLVQAKVLAAVPPASAGNSPATAPAKTGEPAAPAAAAGGSEEIRAAEQELALARQRQAYDARRKLALEKQRQARGAATK